VPEGSGASNANPNWEQGFPYITVFAVDGGTVYDLGNGNYRIRSDEMRQSSNGNTYSVCYEYLHLVPIPESPVDGAIIPPGHPLGNIEDWRVDRDLPLDANFGPSHVHIAMWLCRPDDPLMTPATNERFDPASELPYTNGNSAP
jgi:hypothetical protein